ncbi:MAG TPA: baseplate J/gp47 family protein, partial [Anaerolineales bacterium]|nr:baseplate J/gp47 family protein [Anaerolineales bacterium]
MKTQLIFLDPNDDHASARDKLSWARADRIVLVWPPHGRVLTRRLDLVLLRRAAESQGGKLGLVSHDPDVRAHAQDLGLPVFDTPERLSELSWEGFRPSTRPLAESPLLPRPLAEGPRRVRSRLQPRSGLERAVLALLPPLAMLLLAATIVPAAVIEISPLTTTQSINFRVALDVSDSATMTQGGIPARRLETRIEGDLRQPTTGTVRVPASPASGEVVFTNLTSTIIDLARGTGVQTANGVRFETRASARLQPRSGGKVSVPVVATDPGIEGNVPAGSINAVEGDLGLQVTVTNPEPTQGGSASRRSGVSASDVEASKEALTRSLLQEARSLLLARLEAGEQIAPASIRVVSVDAIRYAPGIGDPGDSLEMHLALTVESIVYREEDLLAYASGLLESQSPDAVAEVEGSLDVELLEPSPGANQAIEYSAMARREIHRAIDIDALDRQLAGRPRN